MQQTLLCLLGIIILSLYGFSRQESYAQRQDMEIKREVEVAALNVFGRWESHLKSLAFDEVMVQSSTPRGMSNTSGLATMLGPDLSDSETQGTVPSLDDFDDFHGYRARHDYPVRGMDLPFDIAIDVEYVNPANPSQVSSIPTTAKRATLTISHTPARADSVDVAPIGLTQLITVTADGTSY